MQSEKILVLLLSANLFNWSEAVSISKKAVPTFVTNNAAGFDQLAGSNLLGVEGGRKWSRSNVKGKEVGSTNWKGDNWEKRNIWTGTHSSSHESALANTAQAGKVKAGGGVQKGQYSRNREYLKQTTSGKTLGSPVSGKSNGLDHIEYGTVWGDVLGKNENTNKEMEANLGGETTIATYSNFSNYLHKKGRTQDLHHEGHVTGGGSGNKDIKRGGATSAKSQTASGIATGNKLVNTANGGFDNDITSTIDDVAQSPEPDRLVNAGTAPDADGRDLRQMSTITNEAWSDNREHPATHTEWMKHQYWLGGQCGHGVWEGTGGCRYECGIDGDPDQTHTTSHADTAAAANCNYKANFCSLTDNPSATPGADAGNSKPCNTACFHKSTAACLENALPWN